MDLTSELRHLTLSKHLALLANQVVEGTISGMHKSPFHGFSSEFSEHKIYNSGQSTRHIDWKLFARTDKLYTKRYEEETNLRCHVIIDNSSSMHYPKNDKQTLNTLNKIGFSVLATATLFALLKRQRDALGLSLYSDTYEYYAPEKSSERHYQMLMHKLQKTLTKTRIEKQTKTYTFLHQIAEKIHRRSMIFLFTDLLQAETEQQKLFDALQHLKYNKHKVVFFHVMDKKTEFHLNFNTVPKQFIDVETGKSVKLYTDTVRDNYKNAVMTYFEIIKRRCAQYKITYVDADIATDLQKTIITYLAERQKFR